MFLSLITDFIIPLLMITIGIVFKVNPKKKINALYGYRSFRSRSSQENWNYSQKLSGSYFFHIGNLLLIVNIIFKVLSPYSSSTTSLINAMIGIVALIIPIIMVETKLRKFDRN